ncbi:hypothetical protein ACWC4D_23435 [Streptomyces sp. NPDC001288]|uniref:hypothetical protein n=1 Tax=unclassified Streptomyces TaxID=2593676 RepID=UPI0033224FA8
MVSPNELDMVSGIDLSMWHLTAQERDGGTQRGDVHALLHRWDGTYWVQLDHEAVPLWAVTVYPRDDPQRVLDGGAEDDETRVAHLLDALGLGHRAGAAPPTGGGGSAGGPADPVVPPQGPVMRSTLFPDLEEACRTALREVNGQADVMVLPESSFPGLERARAVCLKSPLTVRACCTALDALEGSGAHTDVDFAALRARVATDLIVIGAASAAGLDTRTKGILWHEYGHVLHGAAESDAVFAFEVGCVLARFGRDTARDWVLRRPMGYYAATLARNRSGSRLLADLMRRLLTPEEYAGFEAVLHGGRRG